MASATLPGRAAKLESLLEFLVLKKYARVSLLEKHEAHLLDLLISFQKLFDSFRGDCRGFVFWIAVRAGRNGWKRD